MEVINPKLSSEDSLESPLTELGLFRKGTGNTIQLVETERHNLPYGLFILSIYAFWEKLGAASGTLSFENLLAQPYSPGRLFAINREGLLQKLENINDKTNGGLSFDQSSGLSQLIINDQSAFQNIYQEQSCLHSIKRKYRMKDLLIEKKKTFQRSVNIKSDLNNIELLETFIPSMTGNKTLSVSFVKILHQGKAHIHGQGPTVQGNQH